MIVLATEFLNFLKFAQSILEFDFLVHELLVHFILDQALNHIQLSMFILLQMKLI